MTKGTPEAIAELMRESRKTCVLTGAGISTESGIPDFRSPGSGLWERYDPMELLSTRALYERPDLFYSESVKILEPMLDARPNRAHELLAEMERDGLVHSVATQNIDDLHYRAGTKRLYEVHGDLRTGRCLACGTETGFRSLLEKSCSGQVPPKCDGCGGVLRTNVVLFGDPLPQCFYDAHEDARTSDLYIVIGSSLSVAPVCGLAGLARRLVIINLGPTAYDDEADIIYKETASKALESIVNCYNTIR